MSLEKNDFYGKDVAEAIKKACDSLGTPQENLDIEVIETGSTGIFGLIRKKARIRVAIKPETEEDHLFETIPMPASAVKVSESEAVDDEVVPEPSIAAAGQNDDEDEEDDLPPAEEQEGDASPESLKIVEEEVAKLTELMGFPSTLEVRSTGLAVTCTIRGEHEESLAGQDGKVLDSLQYILRKIVSRKVPERLRISINVGDFREKRLEELKIKAAELAAMVKADGKTQVLPGLNPSERRIIHMIFQEDKEIRSRSVGDGLFKKILIYKPGKGSRPSGRKRSQSKGRQGKSGNNKPNRES
jgi:spoIIIJ-associated protein